MKPIDQVIRALLRDRKSRGQDRLSRLWQHWAMVMGEDLAAIAVPLGHKRDILLVGAEDAMAMQDLLFLTPEILERANAFMEGPFFRKVDLLPVTRKTALDKIVPLEIRKAAPYIPPRPAKLGGLRGKLDPDSPIGRCYEAYVAMYERLEK